MKRRRRVPTVSTQTRLNPIIATLVSRPPIRFVLLRHAQSNCRCESAEVVSQEKALGVTRNLEDLRVEVLQRIGFFPAQKTEELVLTINVVHALALGLVEDKLKKPAMSACF